MQKATGAVVFRPAPSFDRLKAVATEDPREVIAQAKHFLNHAKLDLHTQARTYNLLCHTSACVLKRSEVEAAFHGHEAVRLARQIAGREGKALLFHSLVNLGLASERIGEYDRSIDTYREALSMPLDWLGCRDAEETVLTHLGRALYFKGEWDDALTTLDQAAILCEQRQDPHALEVVHFTRGLCYLKEDDLEEAQNFMSLAADITNQEGRYELRSQSHILAGLALVHMLNDEFDQAESYGHQAVTLADEVEDPQGQVLGRMALAHCAKERRRVHQVLELSSAAGRVAFEHGYVPLIQEFTWLMGFLFPQTRD